jgi:arylsulfatase A-like enzyme
MADRAIAWPKRTNDLKPEQPVFLYYAQSATHAPHQPTPDWIAKFKGKFEWDGKVPRYGLQADAGDGYDPKERQ